MKDRFSHNKTHLIEGEDKTILCTTQVELRPL